MRSIPSATILFFLLTGMYSCNKSGVNKKAAVNKAIGKFYCQHHYHEAISAPPYTDTTYFIGNDTISIEEGDGISQIKVAGRDENLEMENGNPNEWFYFSGWPSTLRVSFFSDYDSIVYVRAGTTSPVRYYENTWYGKRIQ